MRVFFLVGGTGYGVATDKNHRRFTLPNQAVSNFDTLVQHLHSPNTDNIIHREAMSRIVACDPKLSTTGYLPGLRAKRDGKLAHAIAYLDKNFDALVLSFANVIKKDRSPGAPESDTAANSHFRRLAAVVRGFDGAVYAFGMGIQDELTADPTTILPGLLDLLQALNEKAAVLAVRGQTTEGWLHNIGITKAVTLGCPSLFVNPTATSAIAPVELGGQLRLASAGRLTRKGMVEKRLQPLLHLAVQSDMDYIYQNDALGLRNRPGGTGYNYLTGELARPTMAKHEARISGRPAVFRRHYLFNNPDIWRGYAGSRDAYIGVRFHGGVAFLQAGRPAGFVYRDARVRELTSYLGLPAFQTDEVLASTPARILEAINDGLPTFHRKYSAALEKFVTTCTTAGLSLVYGAQHT